MALRMEVGLSPGNFVLDGDPAHPPKRGGAPQFSAHVYYGQTACMDQDATWNAGRQVGLGLRDIVLYEDPAPLP